MSLPDSPAVGPSAVDVSSAAPEHGAAARVIIHAEPDQILEAWCDPVVQDHLFANAAERVLDTQGAVRWQLNAPLGQHPAATVTVVERMSTAVVHAIEGDGRWGATSRLTVLPAAEGSGQQVELWLEYEIDGVLARLLAGLVSASPQAMAEVALQRLRTWVEAQGAA